MTMYPVEFFTTYHTVNAEPEWARSERLDYCEPFEQGRDQGLTGSIRQFLYDLFG